MFCMWREIGCKSNKFVTCDVNTRACNCFKGYFRKRKIINEAEHIKRHKKPACVQWSWKNRSNDILARHHPFLKHERDRAAARHFWLAYSAKTAIGQ